MRERERGGDRQREKQAPCREPKVGLDPGSWDHTLSQRQMLNRWANQASQHVLPIPTFLPYIKALIPKMEIN